MCQFWWLLADPWFLGLLDDWCDLFCTMLRPYDLLLKKNLFIWLQKPWALPLLDPFGSSMRSSIWSLERYYNVPLCLSKRDQLLSFMLWLPQNHSSFFGLNVTYFLLGNCTLTGSWHFSTKEILAFKFRQQNKLHLLLPLTPFSREGSVLASEVHSMHPSICLSYPFVIVVFPSYPNDR